MSGAVLSLLALGCVGTGSDTALEEAWVPEEGWANGEAPDSSSLAGGLSDPRGILATADGFLVAERGAGRVVSVVDGTLTLLAEGLDQPYMLAAAADGVLVTERGGGRVLHLGEEITVLAEGLGTPGRIVSEGGAAWWVDESTGELWMVELESGDARVLAVLDAPAGLSWTEQGVLVASAGSCDCVVQVDVETGEQTLLAQVDENPVDVLATEDGVFLSAESHNWPYGGWLYRIDGASVEPLSFSPPGPAWLAANATHLFWVSDENIVAVPVTGGTYQSLGILTAPGDLVVTEQALTWTDRHHGSVLTVELP